MLIDLYILFVIIGFTTFILSLIVKRKENTRNEVGDVTEEERRGSIPLLMVSLVLFSALSVSSVQITVTECENQIDWINITSNENQTQLTNNIECIDNNYKEEGLLWFFTGMTAICIILLIFFGLKEGFSTIRGVR